MGQLTHSVSLSHLWGGRGKKMGATTKNFHWNCLFIHKINVGTNFSLAEDLKKAWEDQKISVKLP